MKHHIVVEISSREALLKYKELIQPLLKAEVEGLEIVEAGLEENND